MPCLIPNLYAIIAIENTKRVDMITTSVVISNGADVVASIPIEYGVTLSIFWGTFSFMVALLIMSYRYGVKVGESKGYDKGLTDGQTKGFNAGKQEFRNSTHVIHDVSCKHYPKDELLKHISLFKKRGDGTVVDVECPYIENDKTCYLINQKCMKFA